MEVCELISLLKKYPEDMDYCIFLCDEYREEYGIGLTDDMQLVRYPL